MASWHETHKPARNLSARFLTNDAVLKIVAGAFAVLAVFLAGCYS